MSGANGESRSLLQRVRTPALIYLVCLGGYLAASGGRLRSPSSDNHFVYLAQGFLEGRLALKGAPPHQNDWSLVTELTLADGRVVRGSFLRTGGPDRFKTTRGERMVIEPGQIRARKHVYYVSFPWFPALLMLPFVAIWGMKLNDVLFNIAVGAFNPVLVFLVLRRLVQLGLSQRKLVEDLWLVGAFAFGTVHFYSSVIGQVWYTGHVVGTMLSGLYVLAALGGRHPVWAGLLLGLGFLSRTPIPFLAPLLVGEVLRRHLAPADASAAPAADASLFARARAAWPRIRWQPTIRDLALGAVPALFCLFVACYVNYLRFDSAFEFGHYYLNVRWTERIQRWGLFNYHFISRNLAVMLALLPKVMPTRPYVQISWHGLGLFFSTPLLLYTLWPRRRSPLAPWLYLAIGCTMLSHLLYQNSGWVQFGYRFALDYMVLAFALLAVGGRPLGWGARALILFGIAVNTFGAITFSRYWDFYWDGMFPVD